MSSSFSPSSYQQALFEFVKSGSGSAVVLAVAGSGKTTSLVHALQQIPPSASAQLFAFNSAIAQELKSRLSTLGIGNHVQASTFHSVGYRSVCAYLGMKNITTDGRKLYKLTRQKLSPRLRAMYDTFAVKLVGLAKGVGIGCLVPDTDEAWQDLVSQHEIWLESGNETDAIQVSRELLGWSNTAAEQEYLIDFDDQLYLVALWGLGIKQHDFVLVDEAQDTNPVRRAFIAYALRPGGRVIAVGDRNQSIYAFTGASPNAIDEIQATYDAIELPLSICYRCPRAIVAKARTLVPQIEASPDAEEGEVSYLPERMILPLLTAEDVVLCRNTAPLVRLAYRCLQQGIGCQILGRDIGKGLAQLVTKMQAFDLEDLRVRLDRYEAREVKRYLEKDQEAKADGIRDRVGCLQAIIHNLPERERTLQSLDVALQTLFGDEATPRLTLSTVHKAKGREWPQVMILEPWLMPARWAKQAYQQQQELNLCYVAWTRARERLFFAEA